MSAYVSKLIRSFVVARAGNRCEYCRIPETLTNYEFHIEHVISVRHGGSNSPDNLAWSCAFCNWKKGTNLVTLLDDHEITPLFNPRTQNWFDHFEVQNGFIVPKTKMGKATIYLLEFNLPEKVDIRLVLIKAGFYP